jgi:hypothetical protein
MERRGTMKAFDWYSIGYLLLSLLSGFLELGIIIYAFRQGMPLVAILLLGVAYQAGALFRRPVELPPWQYIFATGLGFMLGLVNHESIALLVLTVLLLSIGLQGGRELILKKTQVSTFAKRVSRVAGFALSGFFDLRFLLAVAIVAFTTMLLLRKGLTGVTAPFLHRNWHAGLLGVTMLIHQSHYFSYAYFIPFLLLYIHNVSAPLVGLIFCIGWISYSITPFIFAKQSLVRSFLFGHILATLTLFTIFGFFQNFWILILAWFLSGFGGGTVFCLRELERNLVSGKPDLDLWENFGHILGLAISIAVVGISGQPLIVFPVAGVIALLTALLLPMLRVSEKILR